MSANLPVKNRFIQSNQSLQPTPKAFARRGGQADQARWPGK
jgi:hypothetical protein